MSVWQTGIVILLAAAIFGGAAYVARIIFRPEGLAKYQSIPRVTYVHPNVKKLKRAQALVDDGKLAEARAILIGALTTAPKSPVTRQLRELLGEVNGRIFFSKEPSPRKAEYTIERGDALASIARKFDSSAEAIIRVNNLDSTLIRPEQTLLVPRLDFRITVDLPRRRVVVRDQLGFFSQYPIVSVDLPSSRHGTIHTKVGSKLFWKNGRFLRRTSLLEKEGTPLIYLGYHGYALYGVDTEETTATSGNSDNDHERPLASTSEPVSDRPPQGIAIQKKDIRRLEALVRKGTPVTIGTRKEMIVAEDGRSAAG